MITYSLQLSMVLINAKSISLLLLTIALTLFPNSLRIPIPITAVHNLLNSTLLSVDRNTKQLSNLVTSKENFYMLTLMMLLLCSMDPINFVSVSKQMNSKKTLSLNSSKKARLLKKKSSFPWIDKKLLITKTLLLVKLILAHPINLW